MGEELDLMQQNPLLHFIYSVNMVEKTTTKNKDRTEMFYCGDTPNAQFSESAESLTAIPPLKLMAPDKLCQQQRQNMIQLAAMSCGISFNC